MGLRRDLRIMARGWRWGDAPPRPVGVDAPQAGRKPYGWARRRPASAVRAAVLALGFAPLLRAEVSATVDGVEVLERVEPPVLFVANHASHLDAPLVLTALPPRWRDRTAVGAAADYFFSSPARALATALVFNGFPVERFGRSQAGRLSLELLEDGWNLLIFPEGTRSPDGWMGDVHPGAAHLAVATGRPVVPTALWGTYRAMPRGAAWPAPGRPPVRLRFGEPLLPEAADNSRSFNRRIRAALAVLLDEQSSTWWEARLRAGRGETPDPAGPPAARWRRVWEATRADDDGGGMWAR